MYTFLQNRIFSRIKIILLTLGNKESLDSIGQMQMATRVVQGNKHGDTFSETRQNETAP